MSHTVTKLNSHCGSRRRDLLSAYGRIPAVRYITSIWKILRLSKFPLFAILVLYPAFAIAEDYYIDNSVPSSGSGSLASPFKTIQEGIDVISAGGTLWVRGSTSGRTYSESLSITTYGTGPSPISIKAYPGEVVILTGTSGSRLSFYGDYWIIDGLIIDQAGLGKDAIKFNADHITIRNCEVRNGQREGLSIENASFITIEDSYIHDFMWISSSGRQDAHCIMIDTDRGPNITDIKIHRNTIERCSGDGTQIFGETGQSIASYAKNIEFVGNTFIDGTTSPGLTENALDFKAVDTLLVKGNTMIGYKNNKSIVVQKGPRNIIIEDNNISEGLSGIELRQEGGADFIQENIKITRNFIHHMDTYALKFDGVRNVTVFNNTLAHNGSNAFRFESSLGSSVPAMDGGSIKNNLIYDAGSSPSGTSLLSNVDVGYNGWFQADGGGLSQGTDTTGSDPLFTNPSAGDFNLKEDSPAIDAGTTVGLPFFGLAPDLGASEYNPGMDTTPPDPPTGLKLLN